MEEGEIEHKLSVASFFVCDVDVKAALTLAGAAGLDCGC